MQDGDDLRGIVHGQGGLREIGQWLAPRWLDPLGIGGGLHQRHASFRHLAERADHLRMAGVADEQDVAAVLDMPLGLAVDLGHERAGGIDIGQAALLGGGWDDLRYAMGGKHHRHAVRHFVQFLDEYGALSLQTINHKFVMHDLVADVDRRPETLDRQFDDADRAVDAGAKAPGRGNQQGEGRLGGRHGFRSRMNMVARPLGARPQDPSFTACRLLSRFL